jgi:hypothetical protein
MNELFWWLLSVQMVLGAFDILFHHDLIEHLSWRRSQRKEILLHGARNLIYAGVFLVFAAIALHGVFAMLFIALLAAEIAITLIDFVEEDRTRRLPASERVVHAVLAINYGALIALALPTLLDWAGEPTGWSFAFHGWWSALALIAVPGLIVFAGRDFAAAARLARLPDDNPARLAAALPFSRRIFVTGATGFIGRRLVHALTAAGHDVTALVRSRGKAASLAAPVRLITSLDQVGTDARIDAIVNLAGEPISNGLWTKAKRKRIVESRLRVTGEVVALIARLRDKPGVLVNGSAIGWYGMRGDQILDETAEAHDCFTHEVCKSWEEAAANARGYGVRVAFLRTGLVLAPDGGMLGQMLPAFEYGFGLRFGSGTQWMSWIARDDLVRLIAHVIATPELVGPINATAPSPVRNGEFAAAVGKALRRPVWLGVPERLLLLAGDMAREIFLVSQRVVPQKALATGFRFERETIDAALAAMLGVDAEKNRFSWTRDRKALPRHRPA